MTPGNCPAPASRAGAVSPAREPWLRPAVFWRDERVTIYHGDALDVLPALPAMSASAVITDPPYMINALSVIGTAAKTGTWADLMNATRWYAAWYAQCSRILRPEGSLWTCCSWRTLPVVLKAAADAGLPVTSAVVWDKDAITVGGPRSLRGTYEMCAVMAKPEFRIRSRSVPDVWRIKTSTRKPHGHPAEKPEALIRAILAVLDLPPGSRVIDPFLGSGTVAAATRAAGLSCTGIEAEERWCQAAARRLATRPGNSMKNNAAPLSESGNGAALFKWPRATGKHARPSIKRFR